MEETTIIKETCNRLQKLGGKDIVIESDTRMLVDGMTLYWKTNNKSKNIIKYNGNLPASNHLILHELTHLSMFINNTRANKGKCVLTTNNSASLLFSKYNDEWMRIVRQNKTLQGFFSNVVLSILSRL